MAETYINIKDIPETSEPPAPNDKFIIETPEGTYLLDFENFIIGLDNISFASLIEGSSDDSEDVDSDGTTESNSITTRLLVVPTVASLGDIDVTSLIDGTPVYVRGYYSDNDGGEGVFHLSKDAGVSGLENGGTIISSNLDDSYWHRAVPSQIYTPEMFGAQRGNSSVDCSVAIQACIDAHNICFLQSGCYFIKNEILVTNNTIIRGQGMFKSEIKVPDNNSDLVNYSPANGFRAIKSRNFGTEGRNNIVIEDFYINLNGANNRTLTINNGAWSGNTVEFTALMGVTLEGYQNTIRNVRVSGFRSGVSITGNVAAVGHALYNSGRPNSGYGNVIEKCGAHDIAPQGVTGFTRDCNLFTCGAGDQDDDNLAETGRGVAVRGCWARYIQYYPGGTAWSNSGEKLAGNYYEYDGNAYRCNETHYSTNGSFTDDSSYFDLLGVTNDIIQKSPINIFSINGYQPEVSDSVIDNVDGTFMYFDTAELVSARVHDNKAYNISSIYKSVINGPTQTDKINENDFYDNEFRVGVYMTPRDFTSGGTTLKLIEMTLTGIPRGGKQTRFKFRDNTIKCHENTSYDEITKLGVVNGSSISSYIENLQFSENIFITEDNTISFQLKDTTSQFDVANVIKWWNNYNSSYQLIEPEWEGSSSMRMKLPDIGGTFHIKSLVKTEPTWLVEDHFEQIPTSTNGGGRAGWSVNTLGIGAQSIPTSDYSAGYPGVVRLEVGDSTGDKYCSLSLDSKLRLDDFNNWRLRYVFRAGHLATEDPFAFVVGFVNSVNPIHDNTGTGSGPNATAINRGIWITVGAGNSIPKHFFRLYHQNELGSSKISYLNSPYNEQDTDWHTIELQLHGMQTSNPRFVWIIDDWIVLDEDKTGEFAYAPVGNDLFPIIGLGMYNDIAPTNLSRWVEVDSVLVQGYNTGISLN